MAPWQDARHRYEGITQQAVLRPAPYTAVGTGLTGRTDRTRLDHPTRRRTYRRAVGAARAAGAGP